MSRAGRSLARQVATTIVCVGITTGTIAAENKPAREQPAPLSVQEAAKKFEALQSERDRALGQAPPLPRIDAPEFHGPAATPGSKKTKAQTEAEKRSRNWLAEAMKTPAQPGASPQAQSELRRERAADAKNAPGTKESERVSRDDLALDPADFEPASKRERDAAGVAATTPAPNPLAPFLTEWMSPQDLALLRPGLEARAGGTSGATPAALPQEALAPVRAPGASGLAPAALNPPRENPYLQTLTAPVALPAVPPATPAGSILPPTPAAPPPAITPVAPTPLAPLAPRKNPEVARPANDEKYFKQLKRF